MCYSVDMTTLLKKALARVKELPANKQNAAAEFIMSYVENAGRNVQLTDAQLAEVRRRRAEKNPKTLTLKQLDTRLRRLGAL